jgi:large conductance mechanosensitive channel
MMNGFKQFLMRGNAIDLAVGVIVGAAFGGIVDSLVKDIISPILGLLGGQPDFSALQLGPVGIGNFLNAALGFLIKAAGLYFLIVLPYTRLTARAAAEPPPAPAPPAPSPSEQYLQEIRDLLARRQA